MPQIIVYYIIFHHESNSDHISLRCYTLFSWASSSNYSQTIEILIVNKTFFVPHIDHNYLYIKTTHWNQLKSCSAFYPDNWCSLFTSICLQASLALSNMSATLTYCSDRLKQPMWHLRILYLCLNILRGNHSIFFIWINFLLRKLHTSILWLFLPILRSVVSIWHWNDCNKLLT